MAIQFLLFAMANIGVEMLLERQRGLWSRLRSAPVSKVMLLAGKATSGTLISLMILLVSFGFAMIVFKVRIQGSVLGFLGISIACAVMASTFGLLVAVMPVLILIVFAAAFWTIAASRFRWEET